MWLWLANSGHLLSSWPLDTVRSPASLALASFPLHWSSIRVRCYVRVIEPADAFARLAVMRIHSWSTKGLLAAMGL